MAAGAADSGRYARKDDMTRAALLASLSIIVSGSAAATVGIEVPAEVSPFVEPNRTAIKLVKGDVNADGLADYLLVLEDGASERELLILIRQADGSLKLAGRNSTVIENEASQGMAGGFAVAATGDGFWVSDSTGAGGIGGGYDFKFKYMKRQKIWVLVEMDTESYDSQATPPTHKKTRQMPYKLGKVITFDAFNGDNFGVPSGSP
jgi:hypothetical protein